MPDHDAAEQLAEWMHAQFLADRPTEGPGSYALPHCRPWPELAESNRETYRRLARRMLADPPACLVEAILWHCTGRDTDHA